MRWRDSVRKRTKENKRERNIKDANTTRNPHNRRIDKHWIYTQTHSNRIKLNEEKKKRNHHRRCLLFFSFDMSKYCVWICLNVYFSTYLCYVSISSFCRTCSLHSFSFIYYINILIHTSESVFRSATFIYIDFVVFSSTFLRLAKTVCIRSYSWFYFFVVC